VLLLLLSLYCIDLFSCKAASVFAINLLTNLLTISVRDWFTGDGSVRPAPKVAEAEGANYIGLAILLPAVAPFAVIIILDLAKFIKWTQQRNIPRRRQRLPRTLI